MRWQTRLIWKTLQLPSGSCSLHSLRPFSSYIPPVSPNHVYWLESGNIFRNLAFEAALFSNKTRYSGANITSNENTQRPADVIMWRSDPCVVIGRHQNAWLEANPNELQGRGWKLARRMSGGGAVFHDAGNLNISFVESRATMKRIRCMQFLKETLMGRWPQMRVFVGPRYDLWLLPPGVPEPLGKEVVVGALKFSGAASRFSSTVGLHHCTMLFDVNMSDLSSILRPALPQIDTKASRSVRSCVTNLGVSCEELRTLLFFACQEWLGSTPQTSNPPEVVSVKEGEEVYWVNSELFEDNLETFKSWDWVYGNSPKFSIPLPIGQLKVECTKGRFYALSGETNTSIWMEQLAFALKQKPCRKEVWISAIDTFMSLSGQRKISEQEAEIIKQLRELAHNF